jgi:hypothetical protein
MNFVRPPITSFAFNHLILQPYHHIVKSLRNIPVVLFGDRHKPAGAMRDTQEPRGPMSALARAGRHHVGTLVCRSVCVGTLGWHPRGCTVGPRPAVRPVFGTYQAGRLIAGPPGCTDHVDM